jgi:hypothetical protein
MTEVREVRRPERGSAALGSRTAREIAMKLDRLSIKLRRPARSGALWSERLVAGGTDPDASRDGAASRRLAGATLAVVALVALLALALGLLGAALFSDGDSGKASSATAEGRPGAASHPPQGASGATAADQQALERCTVLSSLQRGVLNAARPAMRQWGVHIGAMNQLVAGKITLAQATSFWDRTRVHAAQRVRAFQAADGLFKSSSGSLCPEAAAPPSDATAQLRTCLDAVVAGDATVRAARRAIATWSGHVRDMERLRTGMMSATMAQQMWRQTWKLGDQELRTYRHDDAMARQLSCAP